MKITFLRHGESELNIKGVYYGQLDPSLTEKGRKQIVEVRDRLGEFERVYVSPLKRAIESAKIALGHEEFQVDKRIMELNFGLFEGLSYKEIREGFPEEHDKWVKDGINYRYPKGENIEDMTKRVVDFVEDLKEKGEDVLVVAHFGVICAVLSHYICENINSFWKFKSEVASITTIEFLEGYPVLKEFSIR